MGTIEYDVVAMPLGEGSNEEEAGAALRRRLAEILREQGGRGYSFGGQIEAMSYEKPGCLAGLFGAKEVARPRRYLVFWRMRPI